MKISSEKCIFKDEANLEPKIQCFFSKSCAYDSVLTLREATMRQRIMGMWWLMEMWWLRSGFCISGVGFVSEADSVSGVGSVYPSL